MINIDLVGAGLVLFDRSHGLCLQEGAIYIRL